MYYTYAVGLKFIAAREGSPLNVLHSSSSQGNGTAHVSSWNIECIVE